MLKPYQRRAFLLLALTALEPAAAAARADSDSLWDLLSRTQSLNTLSAAGSAKDARAAEPARPTRRALGPVPGFTLPTSRRAELDALFSSKKKKKSGMLGSVGDWLGRMESATGTKIKVSGYHTMSFRMENISGNTASYYDQQYYGRGSNGVYSDTDLTVDATLFKHFHYQTRISNSLFQNANDNRVKLDYNTAKMRFEWGDINAGFQGNSLIDFNRYLNGVQMSNQWSKQFRTTLLYSQTKAETRTIQISGNNSTGPYYVYAGQIVEGSDRVRVNNRELVKGQDYTLDTYTGELRFTNGNIITQNDSIAVTFETLGYNQTKGNIYGIRTEFAPRSGSRFGLTYVTQTSKTPSGFQTRTEEFRGFETPNAPYDVTSPIDTTKPIIVTVGDRPLVKGVDYVLDTAFAYRVRIIQPVPSSVVVRVQYVPLDTSPSPGNRSVLGLDGQFSLGKWGSLTAETALSGLSVLGANHSGYAGQVRLDLTPFRNFHSNLTLRDVSPTFSSIQSPGFNRNEKSLAFAGDYTPFKNLQLNMSWEKAKRPSYSTGYGVNQFTITSNGNDDYNQYTFGATYRFARNGSINLTRNNLVTNFIQGGSSSNLSDNLSVNYGIRSVTFDVGIGRNRSANSSLYNSFLTTGAATTAISAYNSTSWNKRFGVRWQPTKWLSLNGSTSDNDITTYGTGINQATKATDSQITANFSLIRNLRLAYTYQLSDTGNFSPTSTTTTTGSTGTTTGTTTGSTGTPVGSIRSALLQMMQRTRDIVAGGSSGSTLPTSSSSAFGNTYNANLGGYGNYSGYYGTGSNAGYGYSSFGGKSRTNRITLDYQPRQSMTLGLFLDNGSSVGDYQYNSSRRNVGFTFGWQPSDRLTLNANYSVQSVVYNGSLGNTGSNTLLLSMQGRPFGGKLGIQLNWQSLRTNSNLNLTSTTNTGTTTGTTTSLTDTSSNLSSLALRLDYPLTRRYTLFVEMVNSDSSGYFGSADKDFRIGLDFPLANALKFSLGWQMTSRVNKDPQNVQYNYNVSSLLAELGLRF